MHLKYNPPAPLVSIFLVFPDLQQASFNIGVQKVIVADYWLGSLYCGAKSNLFVVCAASEEGNSFSAYSDINTILAFLTMPKTWNLRKIQLLLSLTFAT